MLEGLGDRFDEELRAGDDRPLWEEVAVRAAEDAAGLDLRLETPPRQVTLFLARMRRHRGGVHPDHGATVQMAWVRQRGEAVWTYAGLRPHVRSRRGCFTASVCVPAGTVGLAWVEVVVLWRPHAPWAAQGAADGAAHGADRGGGRGATRGDHETGRQTYRYRREADGSWCFLGVRDE